MRRIVALGCLVVVVSCGGNADAAQSTQQQWGASAPFVQHPDNIQPGVALSRPFMTLANPYEGNAQRAAEGGKLFVAYNCMDCHGAEGSGRWGRVFRIRAGISADRTAKYSSRSMKGDPTECPPGVGG